MDQLNYIKGPLYFSEFLMKDLWNRQVWMPTGRSHVLILSPLHSPPTPPRATCLTQFLLALNVLCCGRGGENGAGGRGGGVCGIVLKFWLPQATSPHWHGMASRWNLVTVLHREMMMTCWASRELQAASVISFLPYNPPKLHGAPHLAMRRSREEKRQDDESNGPLCMRSDDSSATIEDMAPAFPITCLSLNHPCWHPSHLTELWNYQWGEGISCQYGEPCHVAQE